MAKRYGRPSAQYRYDTTTHAGSWSSVSVPRMPSLPGQSTGGLLKARCRRSEIGEARGAPAAARQSSTTGEPDGPEEPHDAGRPDSASAKSCRSGQDVEAWESYRLRFIMPPCVITKSSST
jgi:hypothetical protein